ncbi:MAG: 3'-5' exonuclease [Nevskiales bacterium]|nr:3'-5' exonuclease [Nevskiales bacterium]
MAVLLPALGASTGRMTSGERRFAERILQKLEDDYSVWYNVPVGPKQLHPDFIILHPLRGFVVLEVKDWKLDTIKSLTLSTATLLTDRGLVNEANPMTQARIYALEVATALERDPALRRPAGQPYAGKLIMPYGWGVVLANITRKQFESTNLGEVLPPGKVICQDEMTESVDPEAFQKRLWDMFTQVFPCKLSLPQVERVRWHLFPELRISSDSGQFGLFDEDGNKQSIAIPDLIKVMDMQQELLARSLGSGHRVIHGVAGSGKTMILGYRCLHLARTLSKPILVLCYNVTLAARLQQLLKERGASDQVSVRNFHDWCGDMLTTYQVSIPDDYRDLPRYESKILATIRGLDNGQIPRAQYGAVLIDEGHDFEPEWFKLVVQMVDPDSNAMLVLYDDAQSIYAKRKRRKFSFASVGIQAQGRTTILKLNYRNTLEILSVAKAFAEDLLNPTESDDDAMPIIAPESAGRRGPVPELLRCRTPFEEAQLIAEQIDEERAHGRALSDIGVLCRKWNQMDAIASQLQKRGIPFRVARDQKDKRALFEGEPSVKIVTLHSSKGLEFGATFIPRICEMPVKNEDESDEARLLYVGMTRATERLVMTRVGESGFSQRLERSIGQVGSLA